MSHTSISLKARLWLLGLTTSLGILILAGAATWNAQRSHNHLIAFVDQHIALNRYATGSYANGLQMGQALRNIVLDPANKRGYDNFAASADKFTEQIPRLLDLMRNSADDAGAASELELRIGKWKPVQQEILEMVKAGHVAEATALLTAKETPAWRAVREILLDQVQRSEKAADAERLALIGVLDTASTLAVAVSLVTFILIVLATILIGRSVYRQVGGEPAYTATTLTSIAAGDLGRDIELGHADRRSILAAAKEMQGQLRELIKGIAGGAGEVLQSSEALRLNAEKVSEAAEQQSAATGAIAAAVEQLTVSIGVVSDNAAQAAALSQDTETRVRAGLRSISATADTIHDMVESVRHSSATMEELSAKVGSINGIAQTIREIADQTNLLALNAAIEAARAGEQGRGFAVVADEVRKLAERTTASTQEISSMLASVQESTRAAQSDMAQTHDLALVGADYTKQVESAVSGLDQAAAAVRETIDQIKTALQEQSAASTDIAQRVERIAQGVDETHLSAASSSERSEQLLALARRLQEQISRFRRS